MNRAAPTTHPRALELLTERAVRPLAENEYREIASLGVDDDDTVDLAAAALTIATTRIDAMPTDVANRLLAAAGLPASTAFPTTSAAPAVQAAPAASVAVPAVPDELAARREKAQRSRLAVAAPWVAAAACLVLAVGAIVWSVNRPAATVATRTPSPAEARSALLASASDVTTVEWTATTDPTATGARGDVVWSQREQRGYMRFVGLAPNDVTKFQYQLWIFDKDRDDKYPVDGGVFDVTSTGEVIVPISAKLDVHDATLFAVTVEKPGGVVVSSRERIVVTAARKS